MSWFQLDPQSVVQRTPSAELPSTPFSPARFLLRGIVGFTVVSLAGFAPWAVFGGWFYQTLGPLPLYLTCAAVFIVLSGIFLHPLIIGSNSLPRFYKLFSIAFTAYAGIWIAAWMGLKGDAGSILGLLGGTIVMGWMLARAFDAGPAMVKIIAVLFVLNTLGYYIGGSFEAAFIDRNVIFAKLLWGLWYGIGFGAGLGIAFYLAQEGVRSLLGSGSKPV